MAPQNPLDGATPGIGWMLGRRSSSPSGHGSAHRARQPSKKSYRLESRYLKPFPTTRVLALREVIAPQHIRPSFGKPRPVPFVCRAFQHLFLRPHDPANIATIRLPAIRARKIGRLKHFAFLKEVTFFHSLLF